MMQYKQVCRLFQEGFLGLSLVGRLATCLKKTIPPDQARVIIQQRLDRREEDFIELVKKGVYNNPQSPYLKLLNHAGCESGDFEKLVRREGLEGALHNLFCQGVFLTSEEFRGCCEIVRGNTKFWLQPPQLHNPFAKHHIPIRSSGSRSHGTQVIRGLDYVRDNTISLVLYLEARKICLQIKDSSLFNRKNALNQSAAIESIAEKHSFVQDKIHSQIKDQKYSHPTDTRCQT